MSIAIKINFNDVYDIDAGSREMNSASFETALAGGSKKELIIEIKPLIQQVYEQHYANYRFTT